MSKFIDTEQINNGGYGCIYYPSIPCIDDKGKNQTDAKYITKIYKRDTTDNREYIMGKRILEKLKDYNHYFGPIVKECKVDMNTVEQPCELNEENDKIHLMDMNKNKGEVESYKVKYLGKQDWGDTFENGCQTLSKRSFEIKTVDSLTYILYSLQKLQNPCGIIHGDLKLNNVMYSENHQSPIIVDFGLSSFILDVVPKEMMGERSIQDILENMKTVSIQCFEWHVLKLLKQIQETNMDRKMLMDFLEKYMEINDIFTPVEKTEEQQQQQQQDNPQQLQQGGIEEEDELIVTGKSKYYIFNEKQNKELWTIYRDKINQWIEIDKTLDKVTLANQVNSSHLLWDAYSLFVSVIDYSISLYNEFPKQREFLKRLIQQCRNFIFDIAKEQTNINTCIDTLNKMRKQMK